MNHECKSALHPNIFTRGGMKKRAIAGMALMEIVEAIEMIQTMHNVKCAMPLYIEVDGKRFFWPELFNDCELREMDYE